MKTIHAFHIELAEEVGVEKAILLGHINYWIEFNRRAKKNFYDGKTWMYQTLDEMACHCPYWSKDKIFRMIKQLTDDGYLVKGNYNKTAYDRTTWYAFPGDEALLKSHNLHIAKSQSGKSGIATPIPDTKTDTEETNERRPPPRPADAPPASDDPSSFVVVSFAPLLVSEAAAKSWAKKYTPEQLRQARAAVLAVADRQNDEALMVTALEEGWKPPEGLKTAPSRNYEYVERHLRRLDGRMVCPGHRLDVLNKTIEVVPVTGTGQPRVLSIEKKSFIQDWLHLLESMNVDIEPWKKTVEQ